MKRPIINPDYTNARYELRVVDRKGKVLDTPAPYRFNEVPPQDVWVDRDKFREWKRQHVIWPYKYVDKPEKS